MRTPVAALVCASLIVAGCAGNPSRTASVERDPRAAQANLELGLNYIQRGAYEQASDKLERASAQDPRNPAIHAALALAHAQLREDETAEEHFRRALALAPGDFDTRLNFGSFLCSRDRYDAAVEQYERAWETPGNRQPAVAFAGAGACMRNAGELEEAEHYLREALSLDARLPYALMQMAELSFEQERFFKTRAYLERYDEVARSNLRSLWLGYRTELGLGDRKAAGRYADELLERFPESKQARAIRERENEQ